MDSAVSGESTEFRTLDYLFEAQKVLTSKNHTSSSSELTTGRENIAAYLRWHLNNRLEQCEEAIGISGGSSVTKNKKGRKEKRRDLSELCANCQSRLVCFKLVPKKLASRKKKKKGRNFETNLLNAGCGQCGSLFQFLGLKKESRNQVLKKRKSSIVNNSFNISRHSLPANRTSSVTSTKPASRKSSITKTPTQTSHKEVLQRMLSNSKKQRSLDSKTRLSDFLSSCFNK